MHHNTYDDHIDEKRFTGWSWKKNSNENSMI